MALKALKVLAESTRIIRRNLSAAMGAVARRRARPQFQPLVAGLEGRQLLSAYRFMTLVALRPGQAIDSSSLAMDSRGDLFGTYNGGPSGQGSVFEIARGSHSVRTLAPLSDFTGWNSQTTLVIDARGNLYGTALLGGANGVGTIFEVKRGSRTAIPLASFARNSSGAQLVPGNLAIDSQGNLFGTATPYGGGSGEVFELAKGSHTITDLVDLGPVGSGAGIGLTTDAQGNLFFTYSTGGVAVSAPTNYVYEIPHGTNTITNLGTIGLVDAVGGGVPSGPVFDSRGNIFGATSGNGGIPSDGGTIFELAKGAQSATTLASFDGKNGGDPKAPVLDAEGNLFGVTTYGGIGAIDAHSGNGTVYELAAGSSTVTTLATFNGADGWAPQSLIADRRGDLFGITGGGGRFNTGTVFELVKVNSRGR